MSLYKALVRGTAKAVTSFVLVNAAKPSFSNSTTNLTSAVDLKAYLVFTVSVRDTSENRFHAHCVFFTT